MNIDKRENVFLQNFVDFTENTFFYNNRVNYLGQE